MPCDSENLGPVARLQRVPGGHYKRVVEGKRPEFLDLCKCNADSVLEWEVCFTDHCLVSEEEFAALDGYSNLYDDKEVASDFVGADGVKEANEFYRHCSKRTSIIAPLETQKPSIVSERTAEGATLVPVESSQEDSEAKESEEQHEDEVCMQDTTEEQTSEQVDPATSSRSPKVPGLDLESMDADESVIKRLKRFGDLSGVDLESEDLFKGHGVPTLFYAKTKVNPVLLFISIDYDLQVIYMSRRNNCRFFPVKLISRLVTDPQVITTEFASQIQADPLFSVECSLALNAANFTDSIALQFSDPRVKERFIIELKSIKTQIKQQQLEALKTVQL